MKEKFKRALIKALIKSQDYILLRDTEGNLNVDANINMLTKKSSGTAILLELLDGDILTAEEITYRLQANSNILSGLKTNAAYYFFHIFIFNDSPDEQKLAAISAGQSQEIMNKRYLKCLSVDLSGKIINKHFDMPVNDSGISKIVNNVFAEGTSDNIDIAEIEDLVLQKEKAYEIKIVARSPLLTYSLIGVNLLTGLFLFLYSIRTGISYSELLIDFGAKENLRILNGEYWRFITPVFLHADITHLLVNSYSLYAVGTSVEKIFGRFKFLTVYLVSGILGNIASFAFSMNPGVGASGAIFGLLGILLYFGLEKPLTFKIYFGSNTIAAILINLVYGFSHAGIDNSAHIGGLIGGFLTSGILSRPEKKRIYLNRYLYLFLTVALTVAAAWYGFNNKQNELILKVNELDRLEQEENWNKAEIIAEEILEAIPDNENLKAAVLWTLTKSEALNSKYDEAVEHGKTLKQIDPQNGNYILGLIYFDMKQYTLSREALLEAKKAGVKNDQIDKLLNDIERLEKSTPAQNKP